MLKFKEPRLEQEYKKVAPQTKRIVEEIVKEAEQRYNKDVTVTSVWRDNKHSVHFYYRGVDFRVNGTVIAGRVRKGGWGDDTLAVDEAEVITAKINRQFVYDPGRPEKQVLIFGELCKQNKHWNHGHVQAHSLTRRTESKMYKTDERPEVTAEDFGNGPEVFKSVLLNNQTTRMTGRRIAKAVTAGLICLGLQRFGLDDAIATIIGLAYLPIEKLVNIEVEKKTGRPANFDIWSLVQKVIGIFKRKEVCDA